MTAPVESGGSILEGQTGFYYLLLEDKELGAPIQKTDLQTLTLTYYDRRTEEIINNRLNQDVLDLNDVTVATEVPPGQVDAVTVVTWALQPADTEMLDARHGSEVHRALFQWSWGPAGEQRAAHQVDFTIENLLYVP